MLYDPKDYTYDECVADYRRRRTSSLDALRTMHAAANGYRLAINELMRKNEFDFHQQMEFSDRLTVCALTELMEQQNLASLRQWFKLVRVVHSKMSREDYHLERIAGQLDLPPDHLKMLVAQFMAAFSTKH